MQKQENIVNKLHGEIMERSGQDFYNCIQCGKCTAGCPVVSAMDLLPREILLYLQMGEEEKLLDSKTPWICASCFTCGARCIKDLDLSRIMEAIRAKMLRPRGVTCLSPGGISEEQLEKLPQQALVSGFRKYTR